MIVGRAHAASPYGDAPWGEVLAHIAQRLQWTDNTFEMLVFDESELAGVWKCSQLCLLASREL